MLGAITEMGIEGPWKSAASQPCSSGGLSAPLTSAAQLHKTIYCWLMMEFYFLNSSEKSCYKLMEGHFKATCRITARFAVRFNVLPTSLQAKNYSACILKQSQGEVYLGRINLVLSCPGCLWGDTPAFYPGDIPNLKITLVR